MLKRFFDYVTRLSVRQKWITIALTILALILGAFALTELNQALLPSIEFPQTIVVAQWGEAESAEQFFDEVTLPLERSLQDVEGVLNIESTTNSGFAFLTISNEFGLNQAILLEEIEDTIGDVSLPAGMEPPQVLNFGPDDFPVVVASVSSSQLSLAELKELVNSELEPDLLALSAISSVAVSGGQELPQEETATEEDTMVDESEPAETASDETGEEVEEPSDATIEDDSDSMIENGDESETEADVDGVALPDSWISAAQAQGFTIATTADAMPELVEGIASFAPQMLEDLTPEMLLALPAESIAVLPADYLTTLDEELFVELQEIAGVELNQPDDAEGEMPAIEIEPVDLPDSWITAAQAQGLEIATTDDLLPELIGGIASFAPEMLDELTLEMLLAMPLESVAALPVDYLAGLDAEVQEALQARAQAEVGQMDGDEGMPAIEPVDLPESWIASAQTQGVEIATTEDLSPLLIEGIASLAPALLDDLTPEMILAMSLDALMALPATYLMELEPEVQSQLAERLREIEMPAVELEPVGLPDSWVTAAESQGVELTNTDDIDGETMAFIAQFAPELLTDLTPEMWLALPVEALAELPAEIIETLENEQQQALALRAIISARATILAEEKAEALAEAEAAEAEARAAAEAEALAQAEAEEPGKLPDLLINMGQQFGVEIENAQELDPAFVRQMSGLGAQANQIFALFTDDNLRLLQPEAIALLPADFLDTLDPDLRAELDELASEYGGAGELLLAEQAEAEAASADSPPLAGMWLETGPNGEEPLFTTAGDLLNNSFGISSAEMLNAIKDRSADPVRQYGDISPEVLQYLVDNEEGFLEALSPSTLELFSPETITYLLDNFPSAFDEALTERLAGIAMGDVELFIPEASLTRTNGDPSMVVSIFKGGDANTVTTAEEIFALFDTFAERNESVVIIPVSEQATFITSSIESVAREGALGAIFAVIIILIFLSGQANGKFKLSWRATFITGLSIPASVLFTFVLMRWIPPTVGVWLANWAESSNSGIVDFLAQLLPDEITLNIITLSGLTVAIGRVVDDSIVVLENIYRYIQRGDDPFDAVVAGTKEVSIAIFSATVTTVVVFLPLGLIGGIIGPFFLPFGLTVTYALMSSFVVAITVVPALTYLLIRKENIPEEKETVLQRWYTPVLKWSLNHRFITTLVALLIFVGSLSLLTRLPQSFIPSLGDPTVNVSVNLPDGTTMTETDRLIAEFEQEISEIETIENVQVEVGSAGGFAALFGGGGVVSQNIGVITFTAEEGEEIDVLKAEIREIAENLFGADKVQVTAATNTGLSGLALVITGDQLATTPPEEQLQLANEIKALLESIDDDGNGNPDIVNVRSTVDNATSSSSGTILRVDGKPAVSFSAELETDNDLGVTALAQQEITDSGILPAGVTVGEGFQSEQQSQSFAGMIRAIGFSIIMVYVVMALTFRSFIYPLSILFSLPFALVGAAIGLFVTKSVLGISAMIGILMLVGIVVTNGIVLMEMVHQRKEGGASTFDALVAGGRVRLRPILMTALAAILALIPLATSDEGGAIIAAELGTAVIGGLFVSTVLTLVVIPVAFSLLDGASEWVQQRQYRRLHEKYAGQPAVAGNSQVSNSKNNRRNKK